MTAVDGVDRLEKRINRLVGLVKRKHKQNGGSVASLNYHKRIVEECLALRAGCAEIKQAANKDLQRRS